MVFIWSATIPPVYQVRGRVILTRPPFSYILGRCTQNLTGDKRKAQVLGPLPGNAKQYNIQHRKYDLFITHFTCPLACKLYRIRSFQTTWGSFIFWEHFSQQSSRARMVRLKSWHYSEERLDQAMDIKKGKAIIPLDVFISSDSNEPRLPPLTATQKVKEAQTVPESHRTLATLEIFGFWEYLAPASFLCNAHKSRGNRANDLQREQSWLLAMNTLRVTARKLHSSSTIIPMRSTIVTIT